jgi:hypothetical protein
LTADDHVNNYKWMLSISKRKYFYEKAAKMKLLLSFLQFLKNDQA